MSLDPTTLTATETKRLIDSGDLAVADVQSAWLARAQMDDLGAFTWVGRELGPRWHSVGGQRSLLHGGRAEPIRFKDPRGLQAAVYGLRR